VLEAFAEVFVQITQPRPAHTAVHGVKRSGLGGVDELAGRLGHGRSLGLRALIENQIGRSFGSDLSEGWVRRCCGADRIGLIASAHILHLNTDKSLQLVKMMSPILAISPCKHSPASMHLLMNLIAP